MGITKTSLFTERQNRVALLAKAIGHPARIAILEHLTRVEGCYCGDLVQELPLAQSTVSQHLKALKQAGILIGEVTGKNVCYCINPAVWSETARLLSELFSNLDNTDISDCC
ncbi:MAG: metalloregulator ArsR/SmtB family transcription factor [Bacteroidota bacterium]